MRKLLLIAPLALAACNSGPTVEASNASVKEVADKVAASGGAMSLTPGRWEGNVTIAEMEIPGLPPEAAAKMKEGLAKGEAIISCLTPEEAKKPSAEFFARDNKDCRYDHFNMTNGRIDAKMQCKSGGSTVDATMVGQFSSDSYQMTMTSKSAGAADQPMSAHKMTMKIDARRTGECKGDEKS